LFLKGEYDARHYRKKRRLQPYHSADYSREELVAELGSAFLCADLELHQEPREDNAAYIANWLEVLKNDNRAIFTAAAHAQRAADYLNQKAAAQVSMTCAA
jgi:antirestriction protein ArdC